MSDPTAPPTPPQQRVIRVFISSIFRDMHPKRELLIKRIFPDLLDREAAGYEVYAQSKLLAYVERPAHTSALDEFIEAEPTGQGMVLTGESSGGKTALLAAWMQKLRQEGSDAFSFER
jgi:hypothetical protein